MDPQDAVAPGRFRGVTKGIGGVIRGLGTRLNPLGAPANPMQMPMRGYLPASATVKAPASILAAIGSLWAGGNIGQKLAENNVGGYQTGFIDPLAESWYGRNIVAPVGGFISSVIPGIEGGYSWDLWDDEPKTGTYFSGLPARQSGTYGMPSAEEQAIADMYNMTYNPETGQYSAGMTPGEQQRMSNLMNFWANYQDNIDAAQKAIVSGYGAAADQANRRARIFGETGQQAAAQVGQEFTQAGQTAADLSQAGGTAAAGLVGPMQAFQSIYGTAPGYGVTASQDLAGQVGFGVQTLEEAAREALKTGSREGKSFADYVANLSLGQYTALNDQFIARQDADQRAFRAERGAMARESAKKVGTIYAGAGGLWAQGGKARENLKYHFGVQDEGQLRNAIDSMIKQYGVDEVERALVYVTSLSSGG